jgi:ribosomal protein S18 acetylase RimI-like enzyme
VIVALNPNHWDEICQIMPLVRQEDTRGIASIDPESGELWGAVVCEDWTVTTVSCHIVINKPRAFRDGLHTELTDYVFNQAGRIKIMGLVPADNDRALKLNRHLGFSELFRIEDGYDWGIDYVVMELKKEDCPYWTPREIDYGQESAAAA